MAGSDENFRIMGLIWVIVLVTILTLSFFLQTSSKQPDKVEDTLVPVQINMVRPSETVTVLLLSPLDSVLAQDELTNDEKRAKLEKRLSELEELLRVPKMNVDAYLNDIVEMEDVRDRDMTGLIASKRAKIKQLEEKWKEEDIELEMIDKALGNLKELEIHPR